MRELKEGRSWEREEISADEAKRRFEAEGEPYKVELVDTAEGDISLYTQGDFTDLCRGPHLQDSKPIKAIKLTSLAGAYWRGDERNTQLTRIYGTAFYSQADLDAYLERLEQARARDHRRLGRSSTSSTSRRALAGLAVLAPEGDGDLERARGRAPARERAARLRRGEDAAHLRHRHSGSPRATGRSTATTCSSRPSTARSGTLALKPMNCPGHMLLFGVAAPELPRPAASATPRRRPCTGTSWPGRCTASLRVRHVTQDDAHIFCTAEQIEDEIVGCLDYASYLYDLFGIDAARRALDAAGEQARHRRGVGLHRGRLEAALERHGIEYVVDEGEGAFYGPKIDLHMTDTLGRSWQMGTIQLDSQMPPRFGLTYMGAGQPRAHAVRRPPRAARLVRALHRHPHRALRRRVPVLARARPGAPDPGRRGPPRGRARAARRGSRPRGSGSTSTSATRRSASGSATPSSRRSRTRSSTATASRRTSLAVRERGGEQSTRASRSCSNGSGQSLLRSRPERRSGPLPLTFPGHEPARVQPSRLDEETWPLLAAVFVVDEEDSTSLVKSL